MANVMKVGTVVFVNNRVGYGFIAPGRLSPEETRQFDPDDPSKVRFGCMTECGVKMSNGDLELTVPVRSDRVPAVGDVILFYQGKSSYGLRATQWCYGDNAKKVVLDYTHARPNRLMIQTRSQTTPVMVWEGSDLSEVAKYLPYYANNDRGEGAFLLNQGDMRAWRNFGKNPVLKALPQDIFDSITSSGSTGHFTMLIWGVWIPCRVDLRYLQIW